MQAMRHLPKERFGALDTIHLHCDGGQRWRRMLEDRVNELQRLGYPSTVDVVHNFVAGPQRTRLPRIYTSHTPGVGREEFGTFSTSLFGRERFLALTVANDILLPQLEHFPGISVELERVIGKIDIQGRWRGVPYSLVKPASRDDVIYRLAYCYPIEIHQTIYLPKSVPPFTLAKLLAASNRLGIEVGGWFDFSDDHWWAYSSNTFCQVREARPIAERQWQLLHEYLKKRGHPFYLRTLVESIIGLWKTPLKETRRHTAFP